MINDPTVVDGFAVKKRTLRALSPTDTEIVAGGISKTGVIVVTVVITAATLLSSIECTPADATIVEA